MLQLFSLLFFPLLAQAALPVGQKLSPLTLSGEEGGLVKGGTWTPKLHEGKIWTLFYVDPDEKNLNEETVKALGALPKIPEVTSVAVINLGATWLPNSIIASKLETSQKEHPRTTYVKDVDKKLVKNWNLGDDTYSISLIGPDLTVLYSFDGKLAAGDTEALLEKIKTAVVALTGKSLAQLAEETSSHP